MTWTPKHSPILSVLATAAVMLGASQSACLAPEFSKSCKRDEDCFDGRICIQGRCSRESGGEEPAPDVEEPVDSENPEDTTPSKSSMDTALQDTKQEPDVSTGTPEIEFAPPLDEPVVLDGPDDMRTQSELQTLTVLVTNGVVPDSVRLVVEPQSVSSNGSFEPVMGTGKEEWTYDWSNADIPVPDASKPVTVTVTAIADKLDRKHRAEQTITIHPYCGDDKVNGNEACSPKTQPARCCSGTDTGKPVDLCDPQMNGCQWAPGTFGDQFELKGDKRVRPETVVAAPGGGAVYVGGYNYGQLRIGNTLPTNNFVDGFVARFKTNSDPKDPTLDLDWLHTFNGADFQDVGDLAVDPKGNLYVTGDYTGNFEYSVNGQMRSLADGVDQGSTRKTDTFVMKMTSGGKIEWAKRAAIDSKARAIVVRAEDDLVVAANKEIESTGDYHDQYVLQRIEPSGGSSPTLGWTAVEDCQIFCAATDLALVPGPNKADDLLTMVGTYTWERPPMTVDLDGAVGKASMTPPKGAPGSYVFRLKFETGRALAASVFGDKRMNDFVRYIARDSSGAVWAAMLLEEPMTNKQHRYCNGRQTENRDIALVKFKSARFSQVVESFCLFNSDDAQPRGLVIDDSDRPYVLGQFTDDLELATPSRNETLRAPSGCRNCKSDAFIAGFETNGDFRWAKVMGGSRAEFEPGRERSGGLDFVSRSDGTTRLFGTIPYRGKLQVGGQNYSNPQSGSSSQYMENGVLFTVYP